MPPSQELLPLLLVTSLLTFVTRVRNEHKKKKSSFALKFSSLYNSSAHAECPWVQLAAARPASLQRARRLSLRSGSRDVRAERGVLLPRGCAAWPAGGAVEGGILLCAAWEEGGRSDDDDGSFGGA